MNVILSFEVFILPQKYNLVNIREVILNWLWIFGCRYMVHCLIGVWHCVRECEQVVFAWPAWTCVNGWVIVPILSSSHSVSTHVLISYGSNILDYYCMVEICISATAFSEFAVWNCIFGFVYLQLHFGFHFSISATSFKILYICNCIFIFAFCTAKELCSC